MSASSFNNTIATITCVLTMPLTATANGRWVQNHPCRAEVNGRFTNQNAGLVRNEERVKSTVGMLLNFIAKIGKYAVRNVLWQDRMEVILPG